MAKKRMDPRIAINNLPIYFGSSAINKAGPKGSVFFISRESSAPDMILLRQNQLEKVLGPVKLLVEIS